MSQALSGEREFLLRMPLNVPHDLSSRLLSLAVRSGRNVTAMLRDAVEGYLDDGRGDPERRSDFLLRIPFTVPKDLGPKVMDLAMRSKLDPTALIRNAVEAYLDSPVGDGEGPT